jgi:GAF domain
MRSTGHIRQRTPGSWELRYSLGCDPASGKARLTRELNEGREQQAATADVLKVISRSTFDLQAVLDTLVKSVTRLCEAKDALIFLRDGELFRVAARYGFSTENQEYVEQHPITMDRGSVVGRTALEGRLVHITDVLADAEYTYFENQKIGGYRTALGAPLLREGNVVGVIFVGRTVVQPFTDEQIALVQNFAAQAVIAIENTRLLNELRESLQQQTATAEVLRVISSSPGELEPVFQKLLTNATRLCVADFGLMSQYDGNSFQLMAQVGADQDYVGYMRDRRFRQIERLPRPRSSCGYGCRTGRGSHLARRPDAEGERADRHYLSVPARGPLVHRQTDRAITELRRPGRHRHRERATAERATRKSRPTDGNCRYPPSHRQHARG